MKIVLPVILGLVIGGTLNQFVKLARWQFRVAFWLTLGLLYAFLQGCATPPHNPPVGIWELGMRMPTDQACYIDTENGQPVLRPCK